MRNRDEKIKNMERSVLPSTARTSARTERRMIHRRTRRRERALLGALRSAPDGEVDFREGRRRSAVHWMVADRRAADKIGPLTRWAIASVRADPDLRDAALHEQVAHFTALLPHTMIGRHAVQHIEWALRYHGQGWPDWRAVGDARRKELRDRIAADAAMIISAGRHGALNDALRRAYANRDCEVNSDEPRPPRRFLLGSHDIQDFADVAATDPRVADVVSEWARLSC